MEIKGMWNFPSNNHAEDSGLFTSDMETFMKDPMSSLAREICQNSIDAKLDVQKPVEVEFKVFEIDTKDIPGKHDLLIALKGAIDYFKERSSENNETYQSLIKIHEKLSMDRIKCMRISDYNTTGLIGVSDNHFSKPFYMLTRGTGVSNKEGTTGGSKGIGKFASFVVSKLHTVFYSTVTSEKESGYIGVSRLSSGYMFDIELERFNKNEITMGIGYFGQGSTYKPISGQFNLDRSYKRSENNPGTDIYILGFEETENWVDEVIAKILESFIYAIYMNKLTLKIEGKVINRDNLETRVDQIIQAKLPISIKRAIKSQKDLLYSEDIFEEVIRIGNSNVLFKIKGYTQNDKEYATNKCTFIRYPYMKIKDLNAISTLPCAAMAIIENDELNNLFRRFENPEHTDWEFNRINIDNEIKEQAKSYYSTLRNRIKELVIEYLSSSDQTRTDFEGASDYLPSEGDSGSGEELKVGDEKIILGNIKIKESVFDIGHIESDDYESLEPDIGSIDDGEDYFGNQDTNESDGGNPISAKEDGTKIDGDSDIYMKSKLMGIRYFVIAKSAADGEYIIKFKHNESYDDCDLHLSLVDDANYKLPINIYESTVNNKPASVTKNKVLNFKIKANEMNKIFIKTDQSEYISMEVNLYASK